jgi:hypothetical protein
VFDETVNATGDSGEQEGSTGSEESGTTEGGESDSTESTESTDGADGTSGTDSTGSSDATADSDAQTTDSSATNDGSGSTLEDFSTASTDTAGTSSTTSTLSDTGTTNVVDPTSDTVYESNAGTTSDPAAFDLQQLGVGELVMGAFIISDGANNQPEANAGGEVIGSGSGTLAWKGDYETSNGTIGNTIRRVEIRDDDPDSSCNPCELLSGTGVLVDHGGDADIGVNWGRWDTGWSYKDDSGSKTPAGYLHYGYSPNASTNTDYDSLGSLKASFNYVNGTSPTDREGNVGNIAKLSFDADFTAGSRKISNYELNLNIAGKGYSMMQSGSVGFDKMLDEGVILNGSCSGSCVGSIAEGKAKVQFLNEGSIKAKGALTSYKLRETAAPNNPVVGVGLLKR